MPKTLFSKACGGACLALLVWFAPSEVRGESAPEERLERIVIDRAEADFRMRYLDEAAHAVTQRDLHYRFTGRFTLNVTRSGDVYVRLRTETGPSFNSDHNYTGVGLGQEKHTFNLKNVFAGWHISNALEVQAGGIDYTPGAGTQATYVDNDGWLEGYRLVWKSGRGSVAPDRVSITAGYVGDFSQPDFFRRTDRLGQVNYFQALAEKSLGTQTAASFDVSGFTGVPYLRFGLKRNTPGLRLIDAITVEGIARTAHNPSFGWSSGASRRLGVPGRPAIAVTYSDISRTMFDRKGLQLVQNGDSMGLGKRLGATFAVSPFTDWEVLVFSSRRLDNTPGVRNRVQLVVKYQLATALNRWLHSHSGL